MPSCPQQMELRYNEVARARNIFERYVLCLPMVKTWVRYAKFEMRNGEVAKARACYERAVEELGEDAQTVRTRCSYWGVALVQSGFLLLLTRMEVHG